jgi:hypothetical protein
MDGVLVAARSGRSGHTCSPSVVCAWPCSWSSLVDTGWLRRLLPAGLVRMKVVVLGFLLRQDEDLLATCPPRSSRSVEFWKAPLANFPPHA